MRDIYPWVKWSKKRPSKPGIYWLAASREDGNDEPEDPIIWDITAEHISGQYSIENVQGFETKDIIWCGPLTAPLFGASRLKELKARQNERQLQECAQMLTVAGVPEWVMHSANEPVPANATPERLKWYLARRKNVLKWETDQKLQQGNEPHGYNEATA